MDAVELGIVAKTSTEIINPLGIFQTHELRFYVEGIKEIPDQSGRRGHNRFKCNPRVFTRDHILLFGFLFLPNGVEL